MASPDRPTSPLFSPGRQGGRPPRTAAIRIALIYAAIGAAWILFSDVVANAIFTAEELQRYHIQTIKGWAFVAVTAGLLYVLIRNTFTAVRASGEAQRAAEKRTRLLVERVRDYAIFTLDTEGKVTSWNRGAMQICQWAEEDILGSHFSIFYTNSDVEGGKPRQHLEEARDVGWSEEEGLRLRKDGTKFRANMQLTALKEENGSQSGFLCVLRDVTERFKAQEALQQANQMLTSAIDASPLPIITLDAGINVRQWNPAAEKMFGWSEEEVLGKPLPTIPESEREGFRKLLSEQAGGKRIVGRELVRQRKDGLSIAVSIWTAPLFDTGGNMSGVMGIFLDLSERNRTVEAAKQLNEGLERRVAERTARLEEANEELAAFSYTVSHDLRLPLRSLQNLAAALLTTQGEKLDEDGRATASRLVGAAARMERQIDDLLEYSRVSRGDLKVEPVSLILVVHELLGRIQRDPAFANAQIIVTEPLGWAMAHHMTLERVILNILVNALTFVGHGTRPIVNIRAQEREGRIRLCIEDNGIGIPMEDRERIFHVFERLPAAEAYPGLGIGLTIARRGVERMGGRIFVEPVASGGTEFIIELPSVKKSA